MRAVQLTSPGGPEVLTVTEVADPPVGPSDLLVDVVATALNRADLLQRRGFYPGPPDARDILGLEFSGRVAAVGAYVREWRVGDAVMGIVGGGGYATRLVIHERQALPVPSTVKVADAAAIPEVFLTAWDALVVQGGLTSGRTALIHAGGSGVGTAGIQIARAIGARSVTTASLGKHDRLRALGAHVVIERSPNDWLAEVLAAVPHGVDVVLDVVGEGDRNVAALRSGGRIVQVGVMGGGGTVSLGALMGKRAAVIGTTLRMRPIEEKISLAQRFRAEMLPLFESGHLVPVIDRRFALDDVAEAHRYMESDANVGKILLDIAD